MCERYMKFSLHLCKFNFMIKSISVSIVFVFLFFINNIYAQELHLNKVDSLLSAVEVNNTAIGSVSLFKSGSEIYNRSFGQKNIPKLKFDKNNKYQVGSITKMVTAILVFKLIEKNKLSLNTKLSLFYPSVPNANKITIRNLLNHTSGLVDYISKDDEETWIFKNIASRDILNEIIRQGVLFEPNENVEYSNSAYYLLTRIVEKLNNTNYTNIVKSQIVKPLNLKHFNAYQSKDRKIVNSFSYNNEWKKVNDIDFSNVIGVGDIVSTTHDLNILLTSLIKNKLISDNSLTLMKPDSTNYGLGVNTVKFYDLKFIGHEGDTHGTHSLIGYNENLELSVAISINGSRRNYKEIQFAILSSLLGRDYNLSTYGIIELDTNSLIKYHGVYRNDKLNMNLTVFTKDSKLYCQATNQDALLLECYEQDKFIYEADGIKIHFKTEDNMLQLEQGGERYIFIKK